VLVFRKNSYLKALKLTRTSELVW